MLKGRGMAWQAKGELTRAMADYDEALKLAPAYGKAIVSRGYGYLARGDYAAAAADLGRAQQLAADPYAALALSLAHLRAGRLDKAELEEYAKRFGTDAWPGPVMAMLHGVLSPAEALNKARDEKGENNREHACTVHFYAGEWYLQQKLVDQARAQLTRARDRCARSTPEFSLASVELSHLH